MLLFLDETQMGAELAERQLGCPSCRVGRLRPWAHARARVVALVDGRRVRLRPRRARCGSCRRTQVLLPAWCAPRRAHGVEVIGAALVGRAAGRSHRAVAADLGVAADTVRGWVRRAVAGAERLRGHAMRHLADLDPQAWVDPADSALADALVALAAAVDAARRRFGHDDTLVWPLAGLLGLTDCLATGPSG